MIPEIAYKIIQQTFFEHEKCGLMDAYGLIQDTYVMHAAPKRSPYKEIFKVKLVNAPFTICFSLDVVWHPVKQI